jgi:hypothetical protein
LPVGFPVPPVGLPVVVPVPPVGCFVGDGDPVGPLVGPFDFDDVGFPVVAPTLLPGTPPLTGTIGCETPVDGVL